MHNKNAHYLAFDYGSKKIGIAVGQALTKTASPLVKVQVKNKQPDWEKIKKLIQEWRPAGLIVGLPTNMDGTEQPITRLAREFSQQLAEKFSLPVFNIDERLTTKSVKTDVFAAGGYKALMNEDIDSLAAQIILESWLRQEFKEDAEN